MTELRESTSRIPQVELLRVMATVGVFLFHLWTVIPLRSDAAVIGPLLERLPLLGTLGVIVFNIITGFVLSIPYLGRPTQRSIPGVIDFFRSRFGRVCQHYYPALMLWAIPWLVFAVHEQSLSSIVLALITHLAFVHTLHASTFFAIVPAFWWLGLLAQFYLIYPWLLRFFVRVNPGKACATVCVIAWGTWIVLTYMARQLPGSTWAEIHYLSYFNLLVRLPEFACGLWLASAWNRAAPLVHGRQRETDSASPLGMRLRPLLVGLTLFLLLHRVVLQELARPFEHIYLVFWSVGTVLAVLRWSWAVRLGRTQLALDVAAASYGIYLLHQPLLGYANQCLAGIFSPASRFAVLLIGIGLLCYRAAVLLNLLVYRMFRA